VRSSRAWRSQHKRSLLQFDLRLPDLILPADFLLLLRGAFSYWMFIESLVTPPGFVAPLMFFFLAAGAVATCVILVELVNTTVI
jgi:hypothetical protein